MFGRYPARAHALTSVSPAMFGVERRYGQPHPSAEPPSLTSRVQHGVQGAAAEGEVLVSR